MAVITRLTERVEKLEDEVRELKAAVKSSQARTSKPRASDDS